MGTSILVFLIQKIQISISCAIIYVPKMIEANPDVTNKLWLSYLKKSATHLVFPFLSSFSSFLPSPLIHPPLASMEFGVPRL
jgi:hypothetical protein